MVDGWRAPAAEGTGAHETVSSLCGERISGVQGRFFSARGARPQDVTVETRASSVAVEDHEGAVIIVASKIGKEIERAQRFTSACVGVVETPTKASR